ncbi:MAG TPA: peptidylprolyl isomerase [Trueperaceae bacterium]
MESAQAGKVVRVHYTGKLDDGTVFDSSEGREPLEFTLGSGQVIAGFDQAVDGMTVGETRSARIPAADAYGQRRDDLMLEVDREQIPEGIELAVGTQLQLQQQDGQAVPVTVAELDSDSVTLDANHPLAGQDLIFELELVGVD